MNKRRFLRINTINELALQLELPVDFLVHMTDRLDKNYKVFTENDKKGKERKFFNGSKNLKLVHKRINRLLDRIEYPVSIQGGIAGRSIYTNALIHAGKKFVANYDIKNFFPSIDYHLVYSAFLAQKCSPNVARVLTRLTTADGHLPQGFATSPKVSGLVLASIDKRLIKPLQRYGLKHSFWIDDLTVSGNHAIKALQKLIYKIFSQERFKLNEHKTKITDRKQKQVCTGLIINSQPNADRKARDQIRKELYLCKKFGVTGFLKRNKPSVSEKEYIENLRGRISFLCSINVKNLIYKEQFEQL